MTNTGLWEHKEAYRYLNTRYKMDQQSPELNERLIADLMKMEHLPWCRTHMSGLFPNYGSDCTCEANDKDEK